MFKSIGKILGGDPIRREMERYAAVMAEINALEPEMQALSDEALRAKRDEFRARLESGESMEDLLPEAFAVVREASVRTVGLRHFDVQLIGGIALHEGKIIEMKTGEGKTLVALCPIYLNALEGKGVHLVTVNDYLARRDARWMGPAYHLLGLSIGVLQEAARTEHGRKAFLYDPDRESSQEQVHQLRLVDRKAAYGADVTYGTNNEFGFDYLRDNMARSLEARSQRGHHYAILDEVDNILVDEARTPLIISGPSREDPDLYVQMAQVVERLQAEDFEVNEKDRTVALTDIGVDHVERLLGSPLRDPDRPEDITPEQARLLGHLEQALRARHLFRRNKDYVVQGRRVIIVDEFTGRLMPGRRWSDGLHQAVEAKEGVQVRQENVTYATVTLQNYFRMYQKLSGMTGTALTEAEEFNKIYKVEVVPLPTNLEYIAMQPTSDLVEQEYRENGDKFSCYVRRGDEQEEPVFWRRKDYPDVIYRTEEAKFRAIATEILARHVEGQPMLVGTTSVKLSEQLSRRLRAEMLQRLAQTHILRDAYMEAHGLPPEGVRVKELEPLYQPLEEFSANVARPMARELELSLNPTQPENLARLTAVLGLDESYQGRLAEVLQGGVPHQVLNAKKHDEESQIIAGAGELGAVTIATNMAGRGVDIKLGGEIGEDVLARVNRVLRRGGVPDPELLNAEERLSALQGLGGDAVGIYGDEVNQFRQFMEQGRRVKEVGGLHVIGSERHEARRIDNQLRGRSARQGDPGSSQFFLSLEDELMRLFGGSQVSGLMQRFNMDDAMPLAHNIVDRTIEQAQTRVEGANFDTRKHLLEYDDVLNQQREVFYGQRDRVLTKDDISEDLEEMLVAEVERHVLAGVEDPAGPWKLLAWLDEVQPPISLPTGEVFPSFTLALLLEQVEGVREAAAAIAALLEVARKALETQYGHLVDAIQEQLLRAADGLQDQVRQRSELAEMALEGASLETEEAGQPVSAGDMIRAVEGAAGVNLLLTQEEVNEFGADYGRLRRRIPELIEASLAERIWSGLVQAVERRVGESLDLGEALPQPIDWDEAASVLEAALDQSWIARRDQMLTEIERELEAALGKSGEADRKILTQLLMRMGFGQRTYFDRRTHRRRTVVIPRVNYAYYAAQLLSAIDTEVLSQRVLEHLNQAGSAIQKSVGLSELTRLGANRLGELDEQWQEGLQRMLGVEAFEEMAAGGTLSSLPSTARAQVASALGHIIVTETYRSLFLSVADRAWVDYLTQMEALRTSIGLEAYAQRDPLVQYKSRAFDMFQNLLVEIRAGMVSRQFRVRSTAQAPVGAAAGAREAQPSSRQAQAPEAGDAGQKPKKKRRRKRR